MRLQLQAGGDMHQAWVVGLVFVLGMPLQVKYPQACDHAAPPEGMHWACANENPCDCHLEANSSEGPDKDSVARPGPKNTAAEFLACRVTYFALPAYPEEARQRQKQGIVSATLVLTADGTVQNVRVESGDPQLTDAVKSAFQQWRFVPGKRAESVPVSVKFVLSNDAGEVITGTSLLNPVVTATPAH
jgi:TonB family protein